MLYNRAIEYNLKQRIIFILLLLFSTSVSFADELNTHSKTEFEPDVELFQKLVQMPSVKAKQELDKLSPEEQYKYSFALASAQLFQLKNTTTAMEYCEYALRVSNVHKLPKGQIYFLQAYIYSSTNRRVETIADLENAAKYFREEKEFDSLKHCLSWLGSEQYSYGNFDKSQQAYEELLQLCTGPDDEMIKAKALFDVGEVYHRVSKSSKAEDVAEQAKSIFMRVDNQKGLADCLKLLGNVYLGENKIDKAKDHYIQAIKAYKNTNDSHGQGNCHFNLGLLSIKQKQYSDAEDYLKEAIYLYTDAGSIVGSGIAQMELGRAYLLQKKYSNAGSALKQAESFLIGRSQYRLAQAKEYLGNLEKARGNEEQALIYYKESVALFKEVKLNADKARVMKKILNLNSSN